MSNFDRNWRIYQDLISGVLAESDLLGKARVVVAVAGMEGALPSVAAGLTPAPVIGVPTSVGYGASYEGVGRAGAGDRTSDQPGSPRHRGTSPGAEGVHPAAG